MQTRGKEVWCFRTLLVVGGGHVVLIVPKAAVEAASPLSLYVTAWTVGEVDKKTAESDARMQQRG